MAKSKVYSRKTLRVSPARGKKPRYVAIGVEQYPMVDGLLDVHGHRLTKAMVKQFTEAVAYRERLANRPHSEIRDPQDYAQRIGLSDLPSKYRPTRNDLAKKRILELSMEITHLAQSISHLRDFDFYSGGVVTSGGCQPAEPSYG